jgi:hypothetical protein
MNASATSAVLDKWIAKPLYSAERGDEANILGQVVTMRTFLGKHETYCPQCKRDALFTFPDNTGPVEWTQQEKKQEVISRAAVGLGAGYMEKFIARWITPFELLMRCTRNESHVMRLHFHFDVTSKVVEVAGQDLPKLDKIYNLTKCGQWPSLVDFRLHQIEDLSAAFEAADLEEWKRSLTTQAHGFNVAACVHLRRMFESLLIEARNSIAGGQYLERDWVEFDRAKMPDRVKLVASELPSFVVEHPELYGVLSKGVHELSEEECARELPLLQSCMKLIAEQRLDRIRRAKNEADVKKMLAQATDRLGNRR